MMTILRDSDPILRKISEPVTDFNAALALSEMMLDVLKKLPPGQHGVALAAPQVGINVRMFIIAPAVAEIFGVSKVMINPSWTPLSVKTRTQEGCLSFPGVIANKRRHDRIVVSYTTEFGVETSKIVDGLVAQIVQHETDHLNGVLLTDA